MAALHAPSASFLSVFLPVARASLLPPTKPLPLLEQLQQRARHAVNTSLIPAALLPIPTLLGELWDGLLNAVPKKKTSHSKTRHRQLAGKALKDVTALNRCSSCGRVKRAHVLCPYCVSSIKRYIANGFRTDDEVTKAVEEEKERLNDEADDLVENEPKPAWWEGRYEVDGRRKKEGSSKDWRLESHKFSKKQIANIEEVKQQKQNLKQQIAQLVAERKAGTNESEKNASR